LVVEEMRFSLVATKSRRRKKRKEKGGFGYTKVVEHQTNFFVP